MSFHLRPMLFAGFISVALASLTFGVRGWIVKGNLESDQVNGRDEADGPTMQRRLAETRSRLERKRHIVQRLIAGELSLLQAADLFRRHDATAAYFSIHDFREEYEGATDEERYCACVLEAVKDELRTEPRRAAIIVARLRQEMRDHLRTRALQLNTPRSAGSVAIRPRAGAE